MGMKPRERDMGHHSTGTRKALGLLLRSLVFTSTLALATANVNLDANARPGAAQDSGRAVLPGRRATEGHEQRQGPRGLPLFVDRLTVPLEVELKKGEELTVTAFRTLQVGTGVCSFTPTHCHCLRDAAGRRVLSYCYFIAL